MKQSRSLLTPRRRAVGFSIVETIVALGILAVGISAVYSQFMNARLQSLRRATTVQARLLAHQELERLRACPYESLRAGLPATGPQPIPGHLRFVCQPTLTTRPDGIIVVQVQVGWDTPPGSGFEPGKSVTARGYRGP